MRRQSAAFLTILAAAALVACGEGGSGADAAAVERTIVASARSEDPADCGRLHTQDFLARMAAGFGSDAPLEFCEEVTEDDSIEGTRGAFVENVRTDGDEATAEASFRGGTFDGQIISFALVREEGDWKIDRMTGFVEFDRDRLLESTERELGEVGDASGIQALADCVAESLRELEDEELKDLMLFNNPDGKLGIIEACARATEGDQDL